MIGWKKKPRGDVALTPVEVEPPLVRSKVTEHGVYELSPSLAAVAAPTSPTATAFHGIAHQVRERHLRDGRRGLAICGASAHTGITFTATNLAIALAQSGVGTLLVEANFRDPSLEALIVPGAPTLGLQHLLRSSLRGSDVIHEDVLPNLSLVFAGGVAADADELVGGEAFRSLLRGWMRDFDCTIVDTPAANRSADARTIAVALGYAAIVGRRGHSFTDDAGLLSQQLTQDGVTVIGSILNDA